MSFWGVCIMCVHMLVYMYGVLVYIYEYLCVGGVNGRNDLISLLSIGDEC